MKHSTFRRTLPLHFLAVAILPTLIFGLIAVGFLHRQLEADIYERNQIISVEMAMAAEKFLLQAEADLVSTADIIAAGNILRPEALDDYLEKTVAGAESIESIYLLDAGRRIKHLGVGSHHAMKRGDYLAVDFSHHAIFQQYPVIDRPVWSDSFISPFTGEPSVTIAVPIGNALVLGNISLQSLGRQLLRFAMQQGDSCAIVDHLGNPVAASVPSLVTQRVNLRSHAAIDAALGGTTGTTLERHGERLMLESTARISRSGWTAWVSVDFSSKMAPVKQLRDLLVGLMLIAIMVAAGVAYFDARRLLRPLSSLSERAGRIGEGNYEIDIPASDFAEINSLALSLQTMSQAIRDREQSLVQSELRFRDLVNSIDGVVWEMDLGGGYRFVSERSVAMFGYLPAQWQDDPDFWSRRVHPDDLGAATVRDRGRSDAGTHHDLEYRFMTAGGDYLWVRDLITVVRDGEETSRLLGVTIDISQRKKTEQELDNYRRSLETLVTMKTRELQVAQAELVQKERLAVLGQLTATVSHEIRNPLGTVANALYLVQETLPEQCLAKIERPLALAKRSVQRCDGIISELLDFTRRRELVLERLRLDEWLAGVLDEVAWPSDLHRNWQCRAGATVLADPERLRRAVINVVTNALQAMEGSLQPHTLEIVTRCTGQRCEMLFTDSGAGIPPENLERIFEPLFSTKNFGVGLGVPIIRNIMTDHGGGVEYYSVPGQGTTVVLWLPPASAETV